MKKLMFKPGVSQYKNPRDNASQGEVDMRRWLYNQLKNFHLNPVDDCCEIYENPILTEVVDVFSNLSSGNTITLTHIPHSTNIPLVFRNGRLIHEYTINGDSITLAKAFGHSSGATGTEEVSIVYKY